MTTENHAPQNNKSTLVVPPQNELIRLLKLVDLGYIDAIEKTNKVARRVGFAIYSIYSASTTIYFKFSTI